MSYIYYSIILFATHTSEITAYYEQANFFTDAASL
jgi:hypothetical protein